MKKIITTVLLAALLLSLFSMTAFAEAPTEGGIYGITVTSAFSETAAVEALDEAGAAVTKTSADIDGAKADFYPNSVQLKVTLSGVKAGDYYLILAQNAEGVPTEANIAYIDQVTAEGTSVSFKVYPGKLDAGTTYYVYRSSNEDERALVLSFKYYVAYKRGDVDESGKVNASDALLVLQYAAKLTDLTTNQQLAADVDKSGKANASDALMILQYAAKLLNQDTWEFNK